MPQTEKIYKGVDSWMYATLNPHVDYQGWMIFGYGLIEMLFHIEPDGSVVPWLAESAECNDDATEWTIKLKDNVTFSDGTPLTADEVILNLEDIALKNSRFGYLTDAEYKAENNTTIIVTLKEGYRTFRNDLADPDTGIVLLGEGQDVDNAAIATGPYAVPSFTPEQKVVLVPNADYWNGEPKLDGAEITLVADQSKQTMAMQNGDVSALSDPSAEAMEIFGAEPDKYEIANAPTSRNYFYYLNCDTMDASVREAVVKAVSVDDFVTVMSGLVVAADGPFLPDAAFGKAPAVEHSTEAAKAVLEQAGFSLNGDGYYEKDGQELNFRLCYYPARSLDKLAALMQEQLSKAGIRTELKSYEDPDAGYVTTGDFDIGLYSCITAPSGDPYYFLDLTMGEGDYNAGNYQNAEVKELLSKLSNESDDAARAEIANKIVEIAVNDYAYGYLGFTVKATILKKGVKNIGEDNPYHGGLNVDSVIE